MGLGIAFLAVALGACAPRQAIVETDPRGGADVRRRLEAAARADLAELVRLESDHRATTGSYAYEPADLGLEPSPGVELSVLEATSTGFSALAQAGSVECAVFVGDAEPPRSYLRAGGIVACRR